MKVKEFLYSPTSDYLELVCAYRFNFISVNIEAVFLTFKLFFLLSLISLISSTLLDLSDLLFSVVIEI